MVEKYLEELEGTDQYEQGRLDKPFALDISQERLPDAEELRQRIRRHEQALEEMKSLGETQILYTDPDARVMKTKDGGRRACYNVQTAVEPQSHDVSKLQYPAGDPPDRGRQKSDTTLSGDTCAHLSGKRIVIHRKRQKQKR